MDETERQASDHGHLVLAGQVIETAEPLLADFSHTSAIGFAVLDEQLRYQAINECLAAINGIPPHAHLGFTTREIFGDLSAIAEPSYHRVLASGETSQFEVKNAVLPSRAGSR